MSPEPLRLRDLPPEPTLKPLAGVIRRTLLLSAGVLLVQPALLDQVQASPQGGVVVAGQGAIAQPDAATTVVSQQSHALAINWQQFNLGAPDSVTFQQPSASAAVLNRILDQSPSQIFGAINANGRVFLMNPNGIVFGPTSHVNVGALFATSLDIKVQDFMDGRYRFAAAPGQEGGAIVNQGLIQAATGGSVTLVGGAVRNEGVIVADVGHVNLAAGRTALVDFDGDGLIRFEVDGEVLTNPDGADAAVSNAGEIRAEGGQVLLSAKVARDVFTRAVNNDGLIKAGGIQRAGGKVMLVGLGGGVRNAGSVDVSASGAGARGGTIALHSDTGIEHSGALRADSQGGDGGHVELVSGGDTIVTGDSVTSARSASGGSGGSVHVLGARVALAGTALVDASGAQGGGEVLVGGDYQGANPAIRNAARTYVGPDVTIATDALAAGDGGRIIVWADEVTRFLGTATGRGGPAGGDGGFVEISGASLVQRGQVDLRAPLGAAGTLLLDPDIIQIIGGTGDSGDGPANGGDNGTDANDLADPTINFGDAPATYLIFESEIEGTAANIELRATSQIQIDDSGYTNTNASPGNGVNGVLAMQTGFDLTLLTRNDPGEAGGISLATLASPGGNEAGALTTIRTTGGDLHIQTGADARDNDNPNAIVAPITLTNVNIVADGLDATGGAAGGNAGTIDIRALGPAGGAITIGGASASGGAANAVAVDTGFGGGGANAILISTLVGPISAGNLSATGGAGAIGAGSANATGNGGNGANVTVEIPATGTGAVTVGTVDVSGGAAIAVGGPAQTGVGGDAGDVVLTARGAFDLTLNGAISATGGAGSNGGANGTDGGVTITSGQDILDGTPGTSDAISAATLSLIAARAVGAIAAGAIDTSVATLTASAGGTGGIFVSQTGDLILGAAGLDSAGGDINLTVAGNLTDAAGTPAINSAGAGAGGAVTITVTGGTNAATLDGTTIVTTGANGAADQAGFDAGTVTITAAGAVDVGNITARGGDAGADNVNDGTGFAGGAGGTVGVTAQAGTLAVDAVDTRGGVASANDADDAAVGGAAGGITLTSQGGTNQTTVAGNLTATGGAGAGGGANGLNGNVTLSSAGALLTINTTGAGSDVNLSGGALVTDAAAGSGAAAGNVTVQTVDGAITVNNVQASGGSNAGGAGGNAGAVTIEVTAASAADRDVAVNGTITATGGNGSAVDDGDGGTVIVRVVSAGAGTGSVLVNDINSSGGTGAGGGVDGAITLTSVGATKNVTLDTLTANAGSGADALVTISAGNSILDGNAGADNILAGNAVLTAVGNGGAIGAAGAGAIDTTLSGTLTANASTGAGGIFIDESGTLQLVGVNAGTGNVELTAGTSITATNGDGVVDVTGNDVTLTATGGGVGTAAAGQEIETNATSLAATAGGAGGIFVQELDGAANGLVIRTAGLHTAGGDIVLNSAGALTDQAGAVIESQGAAAGGNVTIAVTGAGNGAILDTTALNASGAGGQGAGNIQITTANGSVSTGAITATGAGAGNGGNVTLGANGAGGGVTVGGTLNASAADGNGAGAGTVLITAADGAISTGAITAAGGNNGAGAGGNGGTVTLRVTDSDDAGGRNIAVGGTIDTSGGNGTAANGGAGGLVTVEVLNVAGVAGEGAVTVAGMNTGGGTGTGGGNAGNISLTSLGTTRDVTLNGTLTATGGAGAPGTVTINAGQSIVDGNGAANNIAAGTANLTAATGNIGTAGVLETAVANLVAVGPTGINISNTGNLVATLTATGGPATLNVNGTLTSGGAWTADSFDIDANNNIVLAHTVTSDQAPGIDILATNGSLRIDEDMRAILGDINLTTTGGASDVTVTVTNRNGGDPFTDVQADVGNLTITSGNDINLNDAGNTILARVIAREGFPVTDNDGILNQVVALRTGATGVQNINFPALQILADILRITVTGDLELGTDTPGLAPNRFLDGQMDALLGGATGLQFESTGNIILDRAVQFDAAAGDKNLSLIAAGTIDDNNSALAFESNGFLSLTSGGAIGSGGGGSLDIDVGQFTVLSTGGGANAVTVNNAGTRGAGNTLFNIGTGAAVGAVTVVQQAGNLQLGRIVSTTNVSVTASTGSITDNNPAEIPAAGGENIVTAAGTVNLVATAGNVGAAGAAAIDLALGGATLTATSGAGGAATDGVFVSVNGNATLGAINSARTVDVVATGLVQNTVALNSLNNGNIRLASTGGAVTVAGTIQANGTGNVTLNANGLLTVNQGVSSSTGGLTLTGGTGIAHGADGDLLNGGATAITATATTGNLTMVDGTIYVSFGGAPITAEASAGSVQLGQIGTAGTVNVTAGNGSITEVTALEGAGNENLIGTTLTLNATAGIGAAGAAGDIDTSADTIIANGGTGGVFVTETNGGNFTATATGAGDIALETTTGTLNIAGATNAGTGAITLSSADAVTLGAALGDANDGNVTVNANTDGAGATGFNMNVGSILTSGGNVAINVNAAAGGTGAAGLRAITTGAGGTLSVLTNTGGNATGGSITQAAGTTLNVGAGGTLTLRVPNAAAASVGSALANIQSTAAGGTLNLTAGSGGAFVNNVGNLTLAAPTLNANSPLSVVSSGTLTLPGANLSTGTGNITLASNGGALSTAGTLTTTSGVITLTASGLLTVGNALTTDTSAVNLTGSGVTVTSAVDSGGAGNVSINAGGGTFTVGGGGSVDSSAGSLSATAAAVALNGALTGSGTLNLTPSTAATFSFNGAGGFDLTSAEVGQLGAGFTAMNIGRADAPMTLGGTLGFQSPVNLLNSGVSLTADTTVNNTGAITMASAVTGVGRSFALNAGASNITIGPVNTGTGAQTYTAASTTIGGTYTGGSVTVSNGLVVASDSTLQTDAPALGGAVTGTSNLVLVPQTQRQDIILGQTGEFLANVGQFANFQGRLSIGGTAPPDAITVQAGSITVRGPLVTGGDLTVVSLGDILVDAGGSLQASRDSGTLRVISLGQKDGTNGDILDVGNSATPGFAAQRAVFFGNGLVGTEANPLSFPATGERVRTQAAGREQAQFDGLVAEDSNTTEIENLLDTLVTGAVIPFNFPTPDTGQLLILGDITAGLNVLVPVSGLESQGLESLGFIDESVFREFTLYAVEVGLLGPWYAADDAPAIPLERPGDPGFAEAWARYLDEVDEYLRSKNLDPEAIEATKEEIAFFLALRGFGVSEEGRVVIRTELKRREVASSQLLVALPGVLQTLSSDDAALADAMAAAGMEASDAALVSRLKAEMNTLHAAWQQRVGPVATLELPVSGLSVSAARAHYTGASWAAGGIGVDGTWWASADTRWPGAER